MSGIKQHLFLENGSNRFRDGWERCLHFTKEKKFKMNQDAVKVPIGNWAKTRLMKNNGTEKRKITEMSEDDRKRRRSKSGSGLERNRYQIGFLESKKGYFQTMF